MDEQEKCLNKLIGSFSKVPPWSTGTGRVGLDFYRNKNDNVLICINCKNTEANSKYLNDYVVISKDELFLTLFTGCIGFSSIDSMLTSFDEYYGEAGSNDLSAFLQSLETNKIIIGYTVGDGGPKAALVILYNLCQKFNIDCTPIIIKPALFKGDRGYVREFKSLIECLDTHNYHIYDEGSLVHRLLDIGGPPSASWELMNLGVEEDILTIANSMMRC